MRLPPSFVVTSHLCIDEVGTDALERAFADRLGLVEQWPGFQRLEVWRHVREDGTYTMVTWWDDEESFRGYLRSAEHDVSHARVPTEPARPRGVGLDRFTVVAR
jgi:heme-degrading monooxygenase HmoA